MKKKESVKAILTIALVAGTADGLAAILVYQADPFRLFQMISSGILGRDAAFSGGVATFFVGLGVHYFIAACWTVFFFLLYQKLGWLRKYTVMIIIVFGIFIWTVMNLVVVPLSLIGSTELTLANATVAGLILIFAVSLPIVLLTRRADNHWRFKTKSTAA
jgi:small-conductance mechanosensitive channel